MDVRLDTRDFAPPLSCRAARDCHAAGDAEPVVSARQQPIFSVILALAR
jgi:hypothetical protein